MLAEELLQELASSSSTLSIDLKKSLWSFLRGYAEGTTWVQAENSSCIYHLSYLVEEKLVAQYRAAFLTRRPSSLASFISQDINVYLLLTLGVLSQHVYLDVPEVAELLVVVLSRLIALLTDGISHYDSSVCKPPLLEAELRLYLTSPTSTLLNSLLKVLVGKDTTSNLALWDHCLLIFSVYHSLVENGGEDERFPSSPVVEQLEAVSVTIGELLECWGSCYVMLENYSKESLRLLTTGSSEEEPSGTESDREKRLQQFRDGPQHSVLAMSKHLYWVISCALHTWSHLATSWLGSSSNIDSPDVLCRIAPLIMGTWSRLKERYISVITLLQFYGVFLDVWNTWLDVVGTGLEGKTHTCATCVKMATQYLNTEVRNVFTSAIPKLCNIDAPRGRALEMWLPCSLSHYLSHTSIVLEKISNLLSHISSHTKQSSAALKASTSPSQRRHLKGEVADVTKSIGDMASSLLDVSRSQPEVQLGILCLLSGATSDPISIVDTFLPLLSTSSIHTSLHLLERHLAVVEGALGQLPLEKISSDEWWSILSHFGSLMKTTKDSSVVLLVLQHLQHIIKSLPHPIKEKVMQYSVVDYYTHLLSEVSWKDHLPNKIIVGLLKTLEVALGDQRCLEIFTTSPHSPAMLLSLLPLPPHTQQVLKLFKLLLLSQSPTEGVRKVKSFCMATLSRIGLMVSMDSIVEMCRTLSTNQDYVLASLGIREEDQLHTVFCQVLEVDSPLPFHVSPCLLSALTLLDAVWSLVMETSVDRHLQKLLMANTVKEAIKEFAPILASLLGRIPSSDGNSLEAREMVLSILCHLSKVFLILVRNSTDTSVDLATKELLIFLTEVHVPLSGCGLMHLTHGQHYCDVLFSVSAESTPEDSDGPSDVNRYPKQSSKKENAVKKPVQPSSLAESGYEGDLEEYSEEDPCDQTPLPGRSVFAGSTTAPLTIITATPIIMCQEFVCEALNERVSAGSLGSCEVFLALLLSLMKSSPCNTSVIAEENILDHLLTGLSPLFVQNSLVALRCCCLFERVVEMIMDIRVEPAYLKKLFGLFQKSTYHLERLPDLLMKISAPHHSQGDVYPWKPSAYLTFSFDTVSIQSDMAMKILLNSSYRLKESEGFFLSMWFSLQRNSYPVSVHLVSIPIHLAFLEVWACCCTGDVIVRMSPELTWSHPEDDDLHSNKYGNIVNHGAWNHLFVAIKLKQQTDTKGVYEVKLTIDGQSFEARTLEFTVPSWLAVSDMDCAMLVAGGADALDGLKTLLQSQKEAVRWSLSSIQLAPGFPEDSAVRRLYHEGPEDTVGRLEAIFTDSSSSNGDSTSDARLPIAKSLLPYVSYFAHMPDHAFLLKVTMATDPPLRLVREMVKEEVKPHRHCTSSIKPHPFHIMHAAVGVDGLLYLFAKVVEQKLPSHCCCTVLRLLERVVGNNSQMKRDFVSIEGTKLIAHVLKTPQANITLDLADTVLDWCLSEDHKQVRNVPVLRDIVLEWRIWYRCEEVWVVLVTTLEGLLADSNVFLEENWNMCMKANMVEKILMAEKERAQDEDEDSSFSSEMLAYFIRLISCLLGSPPNEVCLKEVWRHVLVPEVNLMKFIARARYDSSFSILDTTSSANTSPEILSPDRKNSVMATDLTDLLGSDNEEVEPQTDHPQASDLLSFEQITALADKEDDGEVDQGTVTLEEGLLGEVRKQLIVLPDSKVSSVLGPIITYESLLAIANHDSIHVRTAAVRLLDVYIKRVDEGVRVSLVQSRAFDLLANQLKDRGVSAQLFSALFTITFGDPFTLHVQKTIPDVSTLPTYQMSSLIPILACLYKSVEKPAICQAVVNTLHQIYTKVHKMAVFFSENHGVHILCQMVVVICTMFSHSEESKNLLLREVLEFMFTIASHSLRAHEDPLLSLRALLGCLNNYVKEIRWRQTRGMLSRTLHVFELLVLQNVMNQIMERPSATPHGRVGRLSPRIGSRRTAHTLHLHVGGEGMDVSSRVCDIVGVAVKQLVFREYPFLDRDVQKFFEPIELSLHLIRTVLKGRVVTDHMDLAFAKILITYLHQALFFIINKAPHQHLRANELGEVPRFAPSTKSSLCEHYSTLLMYLLSPTNPQALHSAVLRYMWNLIGQKEVLGALLTSGPKKKVLSCRLILTIYNLLSRSTWDDQSLSSVLGEVFDCVVHQKESSVIRGVLKLSILLNPATEGDPRVRFKYETTLEDIKTADQKGTKELESQKKDWLDHQNKLYQRLQSQSENRSRIIESSCEVVTTQTVTQQNAARKSILEAMTRAVLTGQRVLQTWRRITMLNTTARGLWSSDERRDMWYQLDPTEGPNRERRRLMKVPLSISSKYFLPSVVTSKEADPPLYYLFQSVSPAVVVSSAQDTLSCVFDCSAVGPDKLCKGRLIINSSSFSFYGEEPLGDPNLTKFLPSDEETVYQSWAYDEIVEVHKRRHELMDNALEFFLSTGKTIFLAFLSPSDRNQVLTEMTKLNLPNLVDSGEGDTSKLKLITASWQQGELTNFEYLMELNTLAGRTFTDLMQYPVFPFIVADYTSPNLNLSEPSTFRNFSLPIAIQNEENIWRYHQHYKELQDSMNEDSTFGGTAPHHYSSHYSNSSTVLHYLVRIPPFTQLFLDFQGQSFDIADRTFHSLSTSWELSSSKSLSDVKELIPEFFYFPEFLLNIHKLDFGQRQTGQSVSDVILPPWALGSARMFVLKHRQALESGYVSRHLHEWVDLIFGYKQQGKAALAATNLFHPSTYISTAIERTSMEDQTLYVRWKSEVKMYGQMPSQLFKDPHPARHGNTALREFILKIGSLLRKMQEAESLFKNMSSVIISRHMLVSRPKLAQHGQDFIGSDGGVDPVCVYREEVDFNHPNIYYLGRGEERLALLTPQAVFIQAASHTYQSFVVTWANWDNAVHILAFDGSVCKLYPPALDQLTCVEGGSNGQVLFTGGSLGVVSCWKLDNSPRSIRYTGEVVHLRGHEGPITCLSVCRPYGIIVSGSTDATAIIWDTNRLSYVATLGGHEGSVIAIATSPTMGDVVTATVNRVNGMLVSVLRIWTVNGALVTSGDVFSEVQCLAYTTAPEGVFVNVIVGGLRNGIIRMWSSWDLSVIRELKCPLEAPISVVSLTISSSSKELYAVFKDDTIAVWVKPE